MAADGSIVIEIEGDDGKLRETLSECSVAAEEALKSVSESVKEAGAAMEAGFAASLSGLSRATAEAGKSVAGEAAQIGEGMVRGVWDGVSAMSGWLEGRVQGYFSGIVDGVKGLLGIHSPSRVFAEIGENMLLGMADGMEKSAPAVLEAVRELHTEIFADIEKREDSFAEKLASNGKLFEKVKTEAGESLRLRDLEEDTARINAFGDALSALREKEIPEELLGEIAKMGVSDGLAVAGELLALTDEEYDGFIARWREKQEAAANVARMFYQGEREALYEEFVLRLPEELSALKGELEDVGVQAMDGLTEGLRSQGQVAIATARGIADGIIAEMQRALSINSPSRKMRDLVGRPAAQGFLAGFEDEMAKFHRLAQETVDRETGKISANAAAAADGKAAASGVTREVHTNNNNTVEKVATVEGDGVTGELIRLLGLRIKAEDRRTGPSLA